MTWVSFIKMFFGTRPALPVDARQLLKARSELHKIARHVDRQADILGNLVRSSKGAPPHHRKAAKS